MPGGREDFNARFAQARHQYPALSAENFAGFLAVGVDPVVRAVAAVAPDRTTEVAAEAYGIGLELVSRRLAGPGSRHEAVTQAWQDLLPRVGALVAAAPRRVLGAVSNAVCQLAVTPGARPAWWLKEMGRLAPLVAGDVENFLRLGQIVAWRAGMAHFRSDALALLHTLPEELAQAVLGPVDRTGLEAHPWWGKAVGQLAARVGGFRGFDGLFTEPPRVAGGAAGHFYVRSGARCWLLLADAFGATFHRATPEEFALAAERPTPPPAGVSLDFGGVLLNRKRVELPFCGEITSHAVNASTLALTASLTHAVLLVALA